MINFISGDLYRWPVDEKGETVKKRPYITATDTA
jgi:hypothetical protein